MKVLILIKAPEILHAFTELDVISEEGGVVSLHHNGECIVANQYQSRINPEVEDIWEDLAERSKIYIKDYYDFGLIFHEMIVEAIQWLFLDYPDKIDFIWEFYTTTEENQQIIKNFLLTEK